MSIRILGIVGSTRIGGNTEILVQEALKSAAEIDSTTELIHLGKYQIKYCVACEKRKCKVKCQIEDDMQKIYPKLETADGFVVGSPVYFGNITANLKAFMDRTLHLLRKNRERGGCLHNKVGGAVVVGGRRFGGQEYVLQVIRNFFLWHGMIVADGQGIMPAGVGYAKGEVKKNHLALEGARRVGQRVVQLVKLTRS